MLKRKLTLIEKIILIGVVGFGLFIILFTAIMKRENKDFYIPKGFSGWINIRYNVPGAPILPHKEGALQIRIPADGNLTTASPFEDGWSRDRFFWYDSSGNIEEIPRTIREAGEIRKWIHWYESHITSHNNLIPTLKLGTDTLLYDKARIVKTQDGNVQYLEGIKTREAMYISPKTENLQFNPPPNPDTTLLIPRLKKILTENKK